MQKEAHFEKESHFDKSQTFRNIKGHLAVDKQGRPHKFCSQCCLMLEAGRLKLNRHFKAHHRGLEPKFLGFNEEPERCIYSDFKEFLLRTD